MKIFYAKGRENYKIKVGSLSLNEMTGEWEFVKHKPHYMRIVGGYGIQKDLISDKKKYDILDIFRKNKNIKIVVRDVSGVTYISKAEDWLRHHKRANYGDGQQIFLSTKYMRFYGRET